MFTDFKLNKEWVEFLEFLGFHNFIGLFNVKITGNNCCGVLEKFGLGFVELKCKSNCV